MATVRRFILLVALALILAACGGGEDVGETTTPAAGDTAPVELGGFVRTPLPEVGGLSLPDAGNGEKDFSLRAGEDGLLVFYFGYTSCPDVCPTTMADLRTAIAELEDDGDRIAVAMATIDPHRDSAEVLTSYVQAFIADGHALRTDDDAALQEVADAFGVTYDVTTGDDGAVEVVHTGSLFAIDDQGRLQVTWPFGHSSDDLARDIQILLDRY